MSDTAPLSQRIRAAVCHNADHAAKGVFNPPPPRETLSQIAAEANGVKLAEPKRHSTLDVHVSAVKPGSLTDRAQKANAKPTAKPVSTQ